MRAMGPVKPRVMVASDEILQSRGPSRGTLREVGRMHWAARAGSFAAAAGPVQSIHFAGWRDKT